MAHFHIQVLASTEPSDSVGLLPSLSLTGECRDGSSLVSATDAAGYTDTRIVTLPKYAHNADHVRLFRSPGWLAVCIEANNACARVTVAKEQTRGGCAQSIFLNSIRACTYI